MVLALNVYPGRWSCSPSRRTICVKKIILLMVDDPAGAAFRIQRGMLSTMPLRSTRQHMTMRVPGEWVQRGDTARYGPIASDPSIFFRMMLGIHHLLFPGLLHRSYSEAQPRPKLSTITHHVMPYTRDRETEVLSSHWS